MVTTARPPWTSATPAKSGAGATDELSRSLTSDGARRRPQMRGANVPPGKTEQPPPMVLDKFRVLVPQMIEVAIVLQIALGGFAEAGTGERMEMKVSSTHYGVRELTYPYTNTKHGRK
jgi:hypothetical protein